MISDVNASQGGLANFARQKSMIVSPGLWDRAMKTELSAVPTETSRIPATVRQALLV